MACESELKEKLEKHFGAPVNCDDQLWADAADCTACAGVLRDKYEAQAEEECFCPKYFGGRVPFSCN